MVDISQTVIELATFQVLNSQMWPVSTVLHGGYTERFHFAESSVQQHWPEMPRSHCLTVSPLFLSSVTRPLLTYSFLQ